MTQILYSTLFVKSSKNHQSWYSGCGRAFEIEDISCLDKVVPFTNTDTHPHTPSRKHTHLPTHTRMQHIVQLNISPPIVFIRCTVHNYRQVHQAESLGIKYMIYRRFKKLIFKSTQKNWFTYRKYQICYPTQKPCLRIFDVPKHTKSCLEKEVGIN